jgi:hypothetical protein
MDMQHMLCCCGVRCSVVAVSRCLVRLIHAHIVASLNVTCMCALHSYSGSDACMKVWRNYTGITHTVLSTELHCWLTVVAVVADCGVYRR